VPAPPLPIIKGGEESEDAAGGWLAEQRARKEELIVVNLFLGSTQQMKRRRNRHRSSHHKQVVIGEREEWVFDTMVGERVPQMVLQKRRVLNSRGRRVAGRTKDKRSVSYKMIRNLAALYHGAPPESSLKPWVARVGQREVDTILGELWEEWGSREQTKMVETKTQKVVANSGFVRSSGSL